MLKVLLSEARAEVERLRSGWEIGKKLLAGRDRQVAEMEVQARADRDEIRHLEAEVGRLRADFASVRVERDGLLTSERRRLDIITKLEAERDALRAKLALYAETVEALNLAGAEIARLRADKQDEEDIHAIGFRLQERVRTLEEALRGLLDKMDQVAASPEYLSVWTIAQLHAGPYRGETWTAEFAAAHKALAGEVKP
jgi:DNA repair ATPase RecN